MDQVSAGKSTREARDVPTQRGPRDDHTGSTPYPLSAAQLVRPPSEHVDFARVVRRTELSRRIGRLAWALAGLTGLSLIALLLVSSPLVVAVLAVLVLGNLTCLVVRRRLDRAPVPLLQP